MKQISYRDLKADGSPLEKREPFKGNSMWAYRFTSSLKSSTGILPHADCVDFWDFVEKVREHCKDGNPDDWGYVVMSYKTPIAWAFMYEEPTIPDVKYSVTTSKSQSLVSWVMKRSTQAQEKEVA
jgi:hypothetical protein